MEKERVRFIVKSVMELFSQQAHNNIQNNRQQDRNNDRTRQRKVEREILALDVDVTGQAAKWDAKSGGKEDQSANEEEEDSPEH
jgi:hypothetical protein